jgi:hypothetical protein
LGDFILVTVMIVAEPQRLRAPDPTAQASLVRLAEDSAHLHGVADLAHDFLRLHLSPPCTSWVQA